MKEKLLSYAPYIGLAIAMLAITKLGWDKFKLTDITDQYNAKLMEADLELGRAKTENNNLKEKVKTLNKDIQKEIKERKAEATRFAEFKASLEMKKPKVVYKTKTKVVYKDRILTISDDLKLPVGEVFQSGGGSQLYPIELIPFTYEDHMLLLSHDVYPNKDSLGFHHSLGYTLKLKIEGSLVETKTKTGAINHYIELYFLDKNNKRGPPFKLEKFNVIINDFTTDRIHWWAPHLDVGVLALISDNHKLNYGGSLGVSFMGYGKTNNDLLLRFLRLSFDLTENPGVGFSPVAYNFASLLPLVSNIWVAPHFSYSIKNDKYFGLSINGLL